MLSIHAPCFAGYSIYFAESIEKLGDNLKEVQPTVFFGVPRVWEKFQAGVSQKMAGAKGVKKVIAEQAMRIGREVNEVRGRGGGLEKGAAGEPPWTASSRGAPSGWQRCQRGSGGAPATLSRGAIAANVGGGGA